GAVARFGTTRLVLGRPVRALAFAPDSKRLAIAGEDDVLVCAAPSGEEIARLHGHADETTAVAFADDGRALVSVGEDGTLRRWRLDTGDETLRLEVPPGASAVLSSDGRWATFFGAWAWTGERLRVLDARTGAVAATLRGSDARRVAAAAFVPESEKLAVVSLRGE